MIFEGKLRKFSSYAKFSAFWPLAQSKIEFLMIFIAVYGSLTHYNFKGAQRPETHVRIFSEDCFKSFVFDFRCVFVSLNYCCVFDVLPHSENSSQPRVVKHQFIFYSKKVTDVKKGAKWLDKLTVLKTKND